MVNKPQTGCDQIHIQILFLTMNLITLTITMNFWLCI